jgi:hypothetical protein
MTSTPRLLGLRQWLGGLVLGLAASHCGARAEPQAAAANPHRLPAGARRPEPITVVERTPDVPFEAGYLGTPHSSEAQYEDGGGGAVPLSPFMFGYQQRSFHLIAYFDGHPQLEAVECMDDAAAPEHPRTLAIVTGHDNRQEYYVDFDDPDLARRVQVPVHRAAVICQVDPDWKGARLEIPLTSGERVALRFVAASLPDSKWSMIPDPGGHNPAGGLVVMHVLASTLAVPPSRVTIGQRSFPLLAHEASRPPYFVAYQSYLSRGFEYAYLNSYPPDAIGPTRRGSAPPVIDGPKALVDVEAVLTRNPHGVDEIAALVAGVPEHGSRLAFNPPFPNLRAMRPATEVSLRFELGFGSIAQPVVYGDVVVKRHADQAEIRLLPRYPGWAKKERRLRCTVTLGSEAAQTSCDADLDGRAQRRDP